MNELIPNLTERRVQGQLKSLAAYSLLVLFVPLGSMFFLKKFFFEGLSTYIFDRLQISFLSCILNNSRLIERAPFVNPTFLRLTLSSCSAPELLAQRRSDLFGSGRDNSGARSGRPVGIHCDWWRGGQKGRQEGLTPTTTTAIMQADAHGWSICCLYHTILDRM